MEIGKSLLWKVASVAAAALFAVSAASAASNHSLNGRGTTANFLCTTTPTPNIAQIFIGASKDKGELFGSVQISGATVQMFGSVQSGSISGGSYSLTGSTSFVQCGTANQVFPGEFTVSGDCGTGVTIHYVDSFGDVGDFLGNVICS